jgi:hypothetical protein
MSDYNKDRLGKIVALAKRGEGGEKTSAIEIVKKICAQHGLDFDVVMGADDVTSEYLIPWNTKEESRVIAQIICRYGQDGMGGQLAGNDARKVFFVEMTKEKYVETMNAIDVLVPLYRKELKKMREVYFHGFLAKHQLYATPTAEAPERALTAEEERTRRAGLDLTKHMEDAHLQRRLSDGS